MALHSCHCRSVLPPTLERWDWDDWELHALGPLGVVGAGDVVVDAAAGGEALAFEATRAESPVSSEASSGYLQDAVAHWSDRCSKRQRMTATATSPHRRPAAVSEEDLQCLLEGFWDSTSVHEGDLAHDLVTTTTAPELSCSFVSGIYSSSKLGAAEAGGAGASGREEEAPSSGAQVSAAQGGEVAAAATAAVAAVPPPPCSPGARGAGPALRLPQQGAAHAAAPRPDDRFRLPVEGGGEPSCSRAGAGAGAGAASTTTATPGSPCPSSLAGTEKRGVGVLYPFAVVKPLGLDDGCMTTLGDVNQRMMKRPARSVRHPVGAFACGPAVSAGGPGMSGKSVVSLTRIRTGEKGTITIIRTTG
ncbi:hypothetical protein ACP4OV_000849 [Aristida adscensionis]